MSSTFWLPRFLHPGAWWLWALGLATAASRTSNPIILALIISVVVMVVASRMSDAPWALAFRLYIYLAIAILMLRVGYRILLGGGQGETVLLSLPALKLPQWAAGIQLLGDITVESVLPGAYDGLRLATMVLCVGAANTLANPKRLLSAVPGALYEVGTAIVVALSVFPQLAESVQRVSRARKLRGGRARGRHAVREVIIPVLADAMERSLLLAAAMDSRGYGRRNGLPPRTRRVSGALMIMAVLAVSVGGYGMLDAAAPSIIGLPMLAIGMGAGAGALALIGRRVRRTRYRVDSWGIAEWITSLSGIVCAAGMMLAQRVEPLVLYPSTSPLEWPTIGLVSMLAVVLAGLPAFVTPPPPSLMTADSSFGDDAMSVDAREDALALRGARVPEHSSAGTILDKEGH